MKHTIRRLRMRGEDNQLIRAIRSRLSLMLVFVFTTFWLLAIHLSLTAGIFLMLVRLGILPEHFFEEPIYGMMFLLVMSFILGMILSLIASQAALKPIRELLSAMRELAGGNFGVRIRMSGPFSTRELREFSSQFNAMAEEIGSIEMLRADFVNNFSHEFKTPVVSLRGFARLLKNPDIPEMERQEYLDIIISESDRLAEMATNVLNLSKIENQTMVLERARYNVSEQIRRIILMMEAKWEQKRIDMEVHLEDVEIDANGDLLSQVWTNLLDNAIKFTPEGGCVGVQLVRRGRNIDVTVRDTGSGMDEDTQRRIFEKFYRGAHSRKIEGHGLGLTVAEKIIRLHQGSIRVESQPGEGSTFTVRLPERIRATPPS